MYRNDNVIPTFSLLFAVALFVMAMLNRQHISRLAGENVDHLSVGGIGLIAFALVLFIYGFIGLLSNWLEGRELRPGIHQPEPSSAPLIAGIVLSLLLVMLSGFFVRLIAFAYAANPLKPAEVAAANPTWLQGLIFAAMMLVIAFLIALYKKFYLPEEVVAEDEKGDFPW